MSAPAAKARPAPVTTTARTSGSRGEATQRVAKLLEERPAEGVQHLGPVQGDERHRAAAFEEHEIGHGLPPPQPAKLSQGGFGPW